MNTNVKEPPSYDELPARIRKELEACSCELVGSSLVVTAPGWVSQAMSLAYLFMLMKQLEGRGIIFSGNLTVRKETTIGKVRPNLF